MAITLSQIVQSVDISNNKTVRALATGNDNYQTGGDTLDLSSYFLSSDNVRVMIAGVSNSAYKIDHNLGAANVGKLKFTYSNNSAELASTTNLAGVTFGIVASGRHY